MMELFRGINGRYPQENELSNCIQRAAKLEHVYFTDGLSYLIVFREKSSTATCYAVTPDGVYISVHQVGLPRAFISLDASWKQLNKFDMRGGTSGSINRPTSKASGP
jgi:hypothetical protein